MNRRDFIKRAFRAGGLAALYGLGLSRREIQAFCGVGVLGGGGTTTKWVGWPNTNGTPGDGATPLSTYNNSADRIYCRRWTATEAGEATHINVQWANITLAEGAYTWLVLFNGSDLIGYADVHGMYESGVWEGDVALTEDSAGSLEFAADDVLNFGLAFDGPGTGSFGLVCANGDTSNPCYYQAATIGSSPPSSATLSASSSYFGLAAILRYKAAA